MSYLDSDAHERRGQSEGSRRNRFSPENQPQRRRQRKLRNNLKMSMLDQIRQPVKITEGGVVKTVEFLDAFLQSLSHQLLKANISDKLKYLEKLDKLGLTGPLADQAKLDRDRAEFETERREFKQKQHDWQQVSDIQGRIADQQKLQWYAAARSLTDVRQACECGACSGSLAQNIETICQTFQHDEDAERSLEELMLQLRNEATQMPGDTYPDEGED